LKGRCVERLFELGVVMVGIANVALAIWLIFTF
jgi:hypothetical protein